VTGPNLRLGGWLEGNRRLDLTMLDFRSLTISILRSVVAGGLYATASCQCVGTAFCLKKLRRDRVSGRVAVLPMILPPFAATLSSTPSLSSRLICGVAPRLLHSAVPDLLRVHNSLTERG
jgi:hypothetical protein